MIRISAIAAMDEGRVIGRENQLPWHIKEDMHRFKKLTSGHAVLMGRKTFESLPPSYKPLPHRKNIVVSRDAELRESISESYADVEVWGSVVECIKAYQTGRSTLPTNLLWIIGGEQIYRETLKFWDELYLTLVHSKHEGDAFFPEFESAFELKESEEHVGFSFKHYIRKQ